MLPEVFECPQCRRQFIFDLIDVDGDRSINCPQCKRYLGEKDVHYVLRNEIEELEERIRFERDRLERDEAMYSLNDCEPELSTYGSEVHRVVRILRKTLADLEALRVSFK